jgi:phytoene dehydrogenase-like protein
VLPGGPAEIARDLVRALRRDGGKIAYNAVVVALRRDRSGVWSARTADGRLCRARTVIANVPVWDLPALLGDQTPRRVRAAGRLRQHGWGAFVVHAAADPAVLPREEHAYVQVLPHPGEPLTEGGMCFISVLPPDRRPGAPRAVSVSTHTEAGRWWGLDRESYLREKMFYTERLLAACERAFPGFRGGLRFVEAATPRTFAHYTLRGGGVVGGLRQDRVRALFGAVSHRSGAPGLFLCGDTVFPGQGTIGVTLSGINAWRSARHGFGLRAGLEMEARTGHSTASGIDAEPLSRLAAGS